MERVLSLTTICILESLAEFPAFRKAGTFEQNVLANQREIVPNEI
jgi:hypothetical protein